MTDIDEVNESCTALWDGVECDKHKGYGNGKTSRNGNNN